MQMFLSKSIKNFLLMSVQQSLGTITQKYQYILRSRYTFYIFFCAYFFLFCLVKLFYEASFLIFVLDETNLGPLPKNSFKSANPVSMTNSTTGNNQHLTTKIVAPSFEKFVEYRGGEFVVVLGFWRVQSLIIIWRRLIFQKLASCIWISFI